MSTLPVAVAVDGSEDSLRALDWAVDAARRRAAALRVCHVRHYAAWTQPGAPLIMPPPPDEDPVLTDVRARLEATEDAPDAEYVGLDGAPGALLPELGAEAELLVLPWLSGRARWPRTTFASCTPTGSSSARAGCGRAAR
jgi:nucleotide-binding universal stress UspA family protein